MNSKGIYELVVESISSALLFSDLACEVIIVVSLLVSLIRHFHFLFYIHQLLIAFFSLLSLTKQTLLRLSRLFILSFKLFISIEVCSLIKASAPDWNAIFVAEVFSEFAKHH